MAQRDKVKELVGRGLDSYHTKALQQMDRIEKKNKEQNHKISILSNELDNDYLTKTEEGSVISLEHSKEGMVYLDELQGNTLVNYCTDGSKEMTLNGDIDIEGTFVTTTEGVDNGLVDVMCEGNTLVNLFDKTTLKVQATHDRLQCNNLENKNMYKESKYTFVNLSNKIVQPNMYTKSPYVWQRAYRVAPNSKMIIELLDNQELTEVVWNYSDGWTENDVSYAGNTFLILEGDWTDKEVPQSYFEGMKSVGQDDENGHKIEILSQNKNYIDLTKKIDTSNGAKMVIEDDVVTLTSIGSYSWCYNGINLNHLKPNTKYICKGIVEGGNPQSTFRVHDFNGAISTTFKNSLVFTTPSDVSGLCLLFYISTSSPCVTGETAVFKNIQLEKSENSTDYVKRQSNKKEILMNEPLRSLPDGTKDKIVKINGKWFIERNTIYCDSAIDNFNIATETQSVWGGETTTAFRFDGYNFKSKGDNSLVSVISDSVVCVSANDGQGFSKTENEYLCLHSNGFIIGAIKTSKITSTLTEYFRANSLKFITKRNTPIYEPLEVEPTLNTYNDVTHISNNSIIPCNMKIQNSGYNAIIKPSTLYTVALDTNKSGTIGMNLGGVKGTTTNNVLKLTTPATLSDDSLRLYGKSIKGSKIRLLEGDKTNWIPSFFEGMKSCFEDKDNNIEINVVNKNLFDINKRINKSSKYWWVIPKGRYNKMSFKFNTSIPYIEFYESNIDNIYNIYTNWTVNSTFTNASQGTTVAYKTDKPFIIMAFDMTTAPSEDIMKTLQVIDGEEIPMDYTPQIINKIQFSSIEPLRGINDSIRDKFVFKDNKLMIERNVTERIINGTEVISPNVINDKVIRIAITHKGNQYKDNKLIKCDGFPSNGDTQSMETAFVATDLLVLSIYKHRLKDKTTQGFINWLKENPQRVQFKSVEPTYEEIPFELQKIILEGYEGGTLFFVTNIPPTSTVTYAGETPIVKSVKLNKTEVLNNTNDINDNIIPYLMDMDYRVVCLQLQSEEFNGGVTMARFFGGTYEMLQRDILSNRYSKEEYKYRLDAYLSANKITEDEYNKLGDMLNE